MKFDHKKNHPPQGLWMHSLKRVIICLALSIPLSLSYSCSSDNDEDSTSPGGTPATPSSPHSVKIWYGNNNMPSGGMITSQYSDSPPESTIIKAVDNNANTKFSTPHSSFYIMWDGEESAAVNYYSLTSADDAPEKDPKSWSLYGSNNNTNWTLLDAQSGQTFSDRKEKKEYGIANEAKYKYYKLEVKSNNGNASTQIAELTMLKVDPPLDPLTPYSVEVDSRNTNMPSSGTITSQYSDFPTGSDIGKIVDNNADTKFVTGHNEFYILWSGNDGAAVNYYSLTSAFDAPEKDPKSWIFSGSNDGETWIPLDAQSDQTFSARKEKKEYLFDNETGYKYYRLEVQDNNGDASTQIAEWAMRGFPTSLSSEITNKEAGFTYVVSTPMGNHYANKKIASEEEKTWLRTAANEPDLIGSVEHLRWAARSTANLYPHGKPMPIDVNQHGVGNCSALAVFASLAYIYPDFVKSLIQSNADGSYTVSMFTPQGEPIEVVVSSTFLVDESGNLQGMTGKNNAITWASVLEKAIIKWNHIYKVNPDIGGIGSEHVAPLFTGNGSSWAYSSNRLNANDLSKVVSYYLTKGMIVIGGFTQSGLQADGGETVSGHAFTLMHSSNQAALFTMRNPWGGNSGKSGDGLLDILNNNIPATIDLRIILPGKAAEFGSGTYSPYTPPRYSAAENKIRVAKHLLEAGR